MAKAVQDSHQSPGCDPIPGVTATPSGSLVTITGAQEIECDVTTDVRVGQPTDRFCSICSACCDRRIGTVAAARLDLDAAGERSLNQLGICNRSGYPSHGIEKGVKLCG